MENFEKIEDLLISKSYDELGASEKLMVGEYFDNASAYNDMRETLLQVKHSFNEDKIYVKSKLGKKEFLLQQFEAKYSSVSATNTRPFYTKPWFSYGAAASILFAVGLVVINSFDFTKQNSFAYQKEHNVSSNNETPIISSASANNESEEKVDNKVLYDHTSGESSTGPVMDEESINNDIPVISDNINDGVSKTEYSAVNESYTNGYSENRSSVTSTISSDDSKIIDKDEKDRDGDANTRFYKEINSNMIATESNEKPQNPKKKPNNTKSRSKNNAPVYTNNSSVANGSGASNIGGISLSDSIVNKNNASDSTKIKAIDAEEKAPN